jgi:hypothetical protein
MANDAGQITEMQAKCKTILRDMSPEDGKKTVNCSWFCGDGKAFRDHRPIISNAMAVYLPGIRSKKKIGLVLLAIGSEHTDAIPVPDDDSWIDDYVFGES